MIIFPIGCSITIDIISHESTYFFKKYTTEKIYTKKYVRNLVDKYLDIFTNSIAKSANR